MRNFESMRNKPIENENFPTPYTALISKTTPSLVKSSNVQSLTDFWSCNLSFVTWI